MNYYFEGDLCQMSNQRNFLSDHGVKIVMSNVYPTVETEEDYKNALSLIWINKCDGWWHYEKQYIKYGICRKSEYNKRLCGNIYLRHMIDKELIPNSNKWWELIESENIKINNIPVKYKNTENGGSKLIYNDIEADENNNIVVHLGDKITIIDKEFIIV